MSNTPEMSLAELQAKVAALETENSTLKASKSGVGATVTFKSSTPVGEQDANGNPGKGTVSAYGLGRRPITAYPDQWRRIFANSTKLAAYIGDHADRLGFKQDGDRQATVDFFAAAEPHLQALADLANG